MTARVIILVTHLLGIGHLMRAARLADGLSTSGMEVLLISGGRQLPSLKAHGWQFLQLPAVQIEGTDFSMLRDEHGQAIDAQFRVSRIGRLQQAITAFRPSLLITEHFPFGRRQLSEEFLAAIATTRHANPAARIVCSIRDVLVAPSSGRKINEANARINELYDLVLVHGDKDVLPLDHSWPETKSIVHRLHYTGYIDASTRTAPKVMTRNDEVVVSGGGSSAALPLLACAIDAAHVSLQDSQAAPLRWHVLVGHGVANADFEALQHRARQGLAHDRIRVERARADFPALLTHCAASVSQAGYNTMLDLVAAACPAVLVPFDAGQETEQTLRATSWAKAGLAEIITTAQLQPMTLLGAVRRTIASHAPTHLVLDTNGVAGSVRALQALLAPA